MTTRRAPRRGSTTAAAVVALASLLAVSSSAVAGAEPSHAVAAHASVLPPALGLAGVVSAGADTYATLRMGSTSGTENLFWEVFRQDGSGKWQLVTPPGVADNGGLVTALAASSSEVLAGFLPSQFLSFSPLGFSSDAGRSWAPGGIDAPLIAAPSALALSGSGAALALVDPGKTRVVSSAGDLTSWRAGTSQRALGAAGSTQRCGFTDLDAVEFGPRGAVVYGGACTLPGVLGILTASASSLALVPSTMSSAERADRLRVVAFSGSSALVTGIGAGGAFLAVARLDQRDGYALSGSIPIGRSGELVSTSVAADGAVVALIRIRGGLRASVNVAGTPSQWRSIGTMPQNTAVVSVEGADDTPVALVAKGKRLTVEVAAPGGARFSASEHLTVPIVYGSSS